MPTITKTGTIQSIAPLGNGKFRIILEDDSYPITDLVSGENLLYGTITTSSVKLNPYVNTPNLTYSDFNAIIGNATDIRKGTLYQDIDYSSNATTPINFDALISGSATKAIVPDSNYSTKRITLPRYEGSRSTSTNFNENSTQGGLGVLPNVEQDRAYFAYFNWVGGTAPEWGNGLVDRSALSIRYFIDSDGNVIEPTKDSKDINLSIVRQTFTEGETAVLSFDDESGTSTNFGNLIGEQTIFKSGKTITPIVYSQTQSISDTTPGGYTGSLTFIQGDQQENDAIGDYRLTAFADGTQLLTNDNTDVEFSFLQYSGSLVNSWTSDTTYSSSIPTPTDVSASLEFKVKLEPEFTYPNTSATFQFSKNGSLVGGKVQVDFSNPTAVFLSYTDNNVVENDTIKLVATAVDYDQGGVPTLSNNSFFKVIQTPPPGIGAVGPDATSLDYWQKFGAIGTAGAKRFKTNALTPVYGQKQQDIEGSGFFGITNDFILQVGDEIRFQGTETQTYKIIQVDNTTSPPEFTVDRGINLTNEQMDWFLVRRYVDAPGQIIIEADKPAGGTSPGFFMPLYSTKGIEDNFDNIIQKLKTEQLL